MVSCVHVVIDFLNYYYSIKWLIRVDPIYWSIELAVIAVLACPSRHFNVRCLNLIYFYVHCVILSMALFCHRYATRYVALLTAFSTNKSLDLLRQSIANGYRLRRDKTVQQSAIKKIKFAPKSTIKYEIFA